MKVYNLRVEYEDGHSKWIQDCKEARNLQEALVMARKKIKQLNSEMVSSIIGKVVAFEIYEGTLAAKEKVEERRNEVLHNQRS